MNHLDKEYAARVELALSQTHTVLKDLIRGDQTSAQEHLEEAADSLDICAQIRSRL